jgi:hypothetical protein
MDRSVATERIVIPARPVRKFAEETARDLRVAINRIETCMGRPFPRDSRLHRALAVLDLVSASGRFDAGANGDQSCMRAIQLALDIFAIAEAMPSHRVADLRKDLELCAAGPLVPDSGNLRSLQAQSQLVVRAAFYRAGVNPTQPTYSGSDGRKKPDILLENGVGVFTVSRLSARPLVRTLFRARKTPQNSSEAPSCAGVWLSMSLIAFATPRPKRRTRRY